MQGFGVNVDPLNLPNGAPDPNLLVDSGMGWVRLVARPGCEDYVEQCHGVGLSVIAVVARETPGDPSFYQDWSVSLWQIGNEMDCQGPSSWTMSPTEYRRLWLRWGNGLNWPAMIGGGLASGDARKANSYLHPGMRAIGVHPYGKTPLEAAELIREYKDWTGMPVWVTEWNRPIPEMKEFAAMLVGEARGACWFCWSDQMVPPMGLVDQNGVPKEEFYAHREAIMESLWEALEQMDNRVTFLEQAGAMRDNVLVLMLQGRWEEAAGLLKALMGGEANPETGTWTPIRIGGK